MADPVYSDKDLYGASGKPQATDIMQGPVGDCYLLAPLGSIATHHPETIQNAIRYDADKGAFSVTMYEKHGLFRETKPVQVEVTQADLKVDRDGGVDNAKYWNKAGDPPLWPQVMESAYAKLKAADKSHELTSDELQRISGGNPDNPFFALTGKNDETLAAHSLSNQDKAYE